MIYSSIKICLKTNKSTVLLLLDLSWGKLNDFPPTLLAGKTVCLRHNMNSKDLDQPQNIVSVPHLVHPGDVNELLGVQPATFLVYHSLNYLAGDCPVWSRK